MEMSQYPPREYNYDDIYLRPRKCVVASRSECDISVTLGGKTFSNPVIASNMKSVVDFDTCRYLASKGMFYIMHRFGITPDELFSFIKEINKYSFSSISVGISKSDQILVNELGLRGIVPNYITIDIAHAHSERVSDMIKYIKCQFPNTFVIAGNVATAEAVTFLEEAGADAVKIFIAPGAACSTKTKTGFTRGTVSCLLECAAVAKKPLIADGGVREPGHIAKAMACGATMVMVGSFMSGYDQSPGEIVTINGHKKYIYYGSASFKCKGETKHIEGTEIILDYKGNMDDVICDIDFSLRSAVSYAGVNRIDRMYGTPFFTVR
jgi:GMP reductase